MNTPASITIRPVLVADLLAEGDRMPVYVHVIDHPEGRVLVDTGARHRLGESLRRRQRMAAGRARRIGELRLDVDEDRSRNVPLEVGATAEGGVADVPASIDEAIAHCDIRARGGVSRA